MVLLIGGAALAGGFVLFFLVCFGLFGLLGVLVVTSVWKINVDIVNSGLHCIFINSYFFREEFIRLSMDCCRCCSLIINTM